MCVCHGTDPLGPLFTVVVRTVTTITAGACTFPPVWSRPPPTYLVVVCECVSTVVVCQLCSTAASQIVLWCCERADVTKYTDLWAVATGRCLSDL